ncbi:MAG: zf-HC2 domain-containing protein [Candidatus Latescibacterota bacterium]
MKCRRAKQLVFDFLDGVIVDHDRISLETHLNECESCEKFTTQVSRSLDLLHRAPEEMPGDNFNWQVKLKIAQEKNLLSDAITAQKHLFKTWNIRFALSAVSTFALILASGFFLWSSGWLSDGSLPGSGASDRFARLQPKQTYEQPARVGNTPPRLYSPPSDIGSLVSGGISSGDSYLYNPGAIDEHRYNLVSEETQQAYLTPDSLVMIKIRSIPLKRRLNQLEGQVEQLQKYLRECEGGQR